MALEIDLRKAAQYLKASFKFSFNYQWGKMATPDVRHHEGKLQNLVLCATFCYTWKYISVAFLAWVNTGRVIFRFNLIFFSPF